MKNIVLLFFLFLINSANSQFMVNAGQDTTVCVTWNSIGPFQFGANPTAFGGTPPYSYTWEANYYYQVLNNTYLKTASYFLSDTTMSNPLLIHNGNAPIDFKLTVTDGNGQVIIDTIKVSFSLFDTNLGVYSHDLTLGDSVEYQFGPNVNGGIPPLNYLWQPNNGLTDSTSCCNFWVKPNQSVAYYVTVSDAVGCVVTGAPVFYVFIGFASVKEIVNSDSEEIYAYPNPFNDNLFLNLDIDEIQKVRITTESGLLVKEYFNITDEIIDLSEFSGGIYLFEFLIKGKSTIKRFVKNF